MTLNLRYNWVKTCDACPEQYDILDENGKTIAYVRARWGIIYCDCPDVMGDRVFSESFSVNDYAGCFEDDEHRSRYFHRIEDAIDAYYKEQNND